MPFRGAMIGLAIAAAVSLGGVYQAQTGSWPPGVQRVSAFSPPPSPQTLDAHFFPKHQHQSQGVHSRLDRAAPPSSFIHAIVIATSFVRFVMDKRER